MPGNWDVVLTSYETLCIEANAFKRFGWYYVVSGHILLRCRCRGFAEHRNRVALGLKVSNYQNALEL